MAKRKAKGSLLHRVDPLTSLLLVFPLFLLYEVGIVLVPKAANGADLITARVVRLLHGQLGSYVLLNAALCALFVGAVVYLRRSHKFEPRMFWPVLMESAIYALTMGTLICFVMVDVLHVDPRLFIDGAVGAPARAAPTSSSGVLPAIVMSLGAGVHEELVFRVVLVGGLSALLQKIGARRGLAIALAFVVSSVLFSGAHHVIGGEPFRVGAFTYRILCGLLFASLYQVRGVAVAVYTHTLYDLYVFLVR